MTQAIKKSAATEVGMFTREEYFNNRAMVAAHLNTTGSATVVDEEGRPLVFMSVLLKDLPPIDDCQLED